MLRRLLTAAAISLLCTGWSLAQNAAPPGAAANMSAPGDYWIYEVKDGITGEIKDIRKFTVTDVSKGEIAVRFESTKTSNSGNLLFDQFWNLKRNARFSFSPNDGMGFKFPLTPNSQWKISIDTTNLVNGQTWKRTGTSKVTGQERISTKAGDFDTLVIETNIVMKNVANGTRQQEVAAHIWYSAEINHWVKRSFVLRENGHVFQSETLELTEYGKKKI